MDATTLEALSKHAVTFHILVMSQAVLAALCFCLGRSFHFTIVLLSCVQ